MTFHRHSRLRNSFVQIVHKKAYAPSLTGTYITVWCNWKDIEPQEEKRTKGKLMLILHIPTVPTGKITPSQLMYSV